jgi:type II secretory pathway pseudopilin PulG
MGQTQVLLIALSVVLVGIAAAVGIDQFSENAMTSNRDAVAADCQRIISQAMQWYRRPASLGGGGKDFSALTFDKIGVTSTNDNGTYVLSGQAADTFTITGTGTENNAAGDPVEVVIVYTASTNDFAYSDNLTPTP